jgi:precorrin-6B methylase 1
MTDNYVQKHLQALRELSDNGYAVVIFTPEEIGDDISPEDLEDYLISNGNDFILLNTKDV